MECLLNPGEFKKACSPKLYTQQEIARIAKMYDGWYENGAWRFPSPYQKDQFIRHVFG